MDDHKLDQFFRDRLSHSDTSPSGAEWEAMRTMLNKDNKRKPVFWWIVGSSIVFLSIAFVFTWNYSVEDYESIEPGHLEKQEIQEVKKESTEQYTSITETNGDLHTTEPHAQNSSRAVQSERKTRSASRATAQHASEFEIAELTTQSNDLLPVHDTVLMPSETQTKDNQTEWLRQVNISPSIPSLAIRIENSPVNISLPEREQPLLTTTRRLPFRYAWSGILMINPTPGQSPIQGMQLGFNIEKPINDHWYLGASPSFHMRVNEQGYSKLQSFTSFGFSAREETYGLQANSLQFLRTPIYLGRAFQRHHMEVGVAFDLLIGARGTLREVALVDQEVQVIESLNTGWIETGDMKHVSADLFLGYKYQVNPYLKTGLSVFINPGKLYPGLPDNRGQLNRKWYMGMQVIYYVK